MSSKELINIVKKYSIKVKPLALSVAVLASINSGCSTPLFDWHVKSGEPVRGAVPFVLSSGEQHHVYNMEKSSEYLDRTERYSTPKGIILIDYIFR